MTHRDAILLQKPAKAQNEIVDTVQVVHPSKILNPLDLKPKVGIKLFKKEHLRLTVIPFYGKFFTIVKSPARKTQQKTVVKS